MSYILEALEKSEQERKQRAVPDLQTQHTIYPGSHRSHPRRLVHPNRRLRTAVLLILLLGLTAWFFKDYLPMELEIRISRQRPTPNTPLEATAPTVPPQITRSEPPAAPADIPVQPAPSIPEQAETSGNSRISTSAVTTEPKSEEGRDEIITSSATAGVHREEGIIKRNEVRLQPAPILLTDNGGSESLTTFEPLPFQDELPRAIQQDLPSLKFAGHTYSSVPEERLIIINNGIKREGNQVEPGLKLEEITWDGVILNFRGIRFQVVTTGS